MRKGGVGTYALVLRLARDREIRVGQLGVFAFPRGYYVYVGSALNGLDARIARHARLTNKRKFWHIDYFRAHAQLIRVLRVESRERLECAVARELSNLPDGRVVVPRFGASDCRCATHLFLIFPDLQFRCEYAKLLNAPL